jgi:hypothetical protein
MLYLSGHVRPDMPAMLTPRMYQKPPPGQLWAADTGCFRDPGSFNFARYLIWLNELAANGDAERCLFATAEDRVGNAALTLELSWPQFAYIQEIGYEVALVAQDGLENERVPWEEFECLFIGGTNAWRKTEAPYRLAQEAREQGKWLHMGRVNSLKAMRRAEQYGCDSVDGTFLKFAPDTNLPRMQKWFDELHRAPSVWGKK